MRKTTAVIVALVGAGVSETALAYVGPGAGLSLLGALWGLLLAVGAAMAFLILWPIRQAHRRARAKRQAQAVGDHPAAADARADEPGGRLKTSAPRHRRRGP